MKFSGILAVACTVLPVFGAAVPANDVALEARAFGSEIVTSIKNVQAATDKVDAEVVKVKSADLTQLLAVNTAAQNLASVISTETANVQKQAAVDPIGALNIQIATGGLIDSVKKLSKDIIAIKPYVVQAGVTSVVLSTLQTQKQGADTFADTLSSKIPSLFAPIANFDKQQVDDALNQAIQAYSS